MLIQNFSRKIRVHKRVVSFLKLFVLVTGIGRVKADKWMFRPSFVKAFVWFLLRVSFEMSLRRAVSVSTSINKGTPFAPFSSNHLIRLNNHWIYREICYCRRRRHSNINFYAISAAELESLVMCQGCLFKAGSRRASLPARSMALDYTEHALPHLSCEMSSLHAEWFDKQHLRGALSASRRFLMTQVNVNYRIDADNIIILNWKD